MARIGGFVVATLFAVHLAPAFCVDELEVYLAKGFEEACEEDQQCVNMMQKRAVRHHVPPEGAADAAPVPEGADAAAPAPEEAGSAEPTAGVNMSDPVVVADIHDMMTAANSIQAESVMEGDITGGVGELFKQSGGWYQGGDKIWGGGAGMENINSGNVGYYNSGMYAARARCADGGCTLMTNPAGHRTVNQFHIHFFHYAGGYARSLKDKLAHMTCYHPGWHSGGLPCGGKAIFVSGFPGIFSTAMSGGSISHASVIAWPSSCGGRGTIVQIAYGCSIEHQIRGDYDPSKR